MATFIYRAETADGTEVTETVTAEDRYAVYDIARSREHTVRSITKQSERSLACFFSMERINALLSRVKQDDIVMLSRNLSAMLNAGLSLSRGLSVAERQSANPALARVLASVRDDVANGQTLHDALAKHADTFSKLYIAMVRAGEESGKLADALGTIAVQLQRSSNLVKKIRGAMIYPAIVLLAMGVIGVLMMIYVVPTLTETFTELDVELPVMTQVFIGVSTFLSKYTVVALGGMVLVIVGVAASLKTTLGRRVLAFVLLHLPVIGTLVRETNAARTGRTLSSLLHSGVGLVDALAITGEVVQNPYHRDVLAEAAKAVEKGRQMSEVFSEHEALYPVLVGEMTAVGEETGAIADMLGEVADFFEHEVERKTEDLSTIIEPVLMIVIGTVVGIFALAMIAPIYSISDSIG